MIFLAMRSTDRRDRLHAPETGRVIDARATAVGLRLLGGIVAFEMSY
jgi:hypothetical protein